MARFTMTRLTVVDLARIAVFAALIAALAQASVHLFGNAVPITGQTLGVMLAGLVLAAGVLWDPLTRAADRAARSFDKPPPPVSEKRS